MMQKRFLTHALAFCFGALVNLVIISNTGIYKAGYIKGKSETLDAVAKDFGECRESFQLALETARGRAEICEKKSDDIIKRCFGE